MFIVDGVYGELCDEYHQPWPMPFVVRWFAHTDHKYTCMAY